jgi:Arc/MetJ-type ribon-helix-helix transcriptional regulator
MYKMNDEYILFQTKLPATYGRRVDTLIELGLYASRAEYMRHLIGQDMYFRYEEEQPMSEEKKEFDDTSKEKTIREVFFEEQLREIGATVEDFQAFLESKKEVTETLVETETHYTDEPIPEDEQYMGEPKSVSVFTRPKVEPERVIPRDMRGTDELEEQQSYGIKLFKDQSEDKRAEWARQKKEKER